MLVAIVLLPFGGGRLCEKRVDVNNLNFELVAAFAVLRERMRQSRTEGRGPRKTHLCRHLGEVDLDDLMRVREPIFGAHVKVGTFGHVIHWAGDKRQASASRARLS